MQTREPRKRVNWIFVVILIIAIPIVLLVLFMMNLLPYQTKPTTVNPNDSIVVPSPKPDSTVDTLRKNVRKK